MPEIRLERVSATHADGSEAVSEVSLTIAENELMVLLGPSGAGKSTLLRLIAGLDRASSGEIWFGSHRVNDLDPKKRQLALIFPSPALLPGLTVRRNLEFGMRLRGVRRLDRAQRIEAVAQELGLAQLLERAPASLSPGQRQRVALGRALLRDPVALLLDEPLTGLDDRQRGAMRTEILRLHRRIGRTMLYATRDQAEAMTTAQRLCIMDEGRIVQVGPPLEVYRNPANVFVAGLLASPPMNLVTARMIEDGQRGLAAEAPGLLIAWPEPERSAYASYRDRKIVVGIRPEDLWIEAYAPAAAPLDVEVVALEAMGAEIVLVGALPGMHGPELAARLPPEFTVPPGTTQRLWIDPARIRLFDANTGAAVPPP